LVSCSKEEDIGPKVVAELAAIDVAPPSSRFHVVVLLASRKDGPMPELPAGEAKALADFKRVMTYRSFTLDAETMIASDRNAMTQLNDSYGLEFALTKMAGSDVIDVRPALSHPLSRRQGHSPVSLRGLVVFAHTARARGRHPYEQARHGRRRLARRQRHRAGAAAEAVFESGFTKGFERLDAVRDKYRNEPWYRDVHGNYTHFILPYTATEAREKFKNSLPGTPFRYDPMPTLRAVKTPQLWILGEDDLEAPSAETSRRIKTLIVEGKPITLALFPHAEHGMTEYEIASNGERVSTRYAPGYFAIMRDFTRNGRLSGSYGSSTVVEPKTHSAVECR
jgi:hypothetical protein